MDNLREVLGLRRPFSLVNVVTCVQRATSDCAEVPAEEKEGPKPSRRRATPKGRAVCVPHSAAAARNWLRKGGVTQRLCAVPSSRTRSHVPTQCSCTRWVARSSVGSRVARRLPGRHSLVAARPLRCRSGLSAGRGGSGRPPPWCPQGGLLPASACLSSVGRD